MGKKRGGLAIVNRGFYPLTNPVREGLLKFAETVARGGRVSIITQYSGRLTRDLGEIGRGAGIRFLDCPNWSNSAHGLATRTLDSLFFMAWTFISLLRCRPTQVYVATDPPVIVPFIVFIYCKLLGAQYYYHLQDIHPEATSIVVRLNPILYRVLLMMDNAVIRHAEALITLSEDMRLHVVERSKTKSPVYLLDNPAVSVDDRPATAVEGDVVFSGSAGRLQRIPLVLEAICDYLAQGGKLRFTFVGPGVYVPELLRISKEFENFTYRGVVSAAEAANLVSRHRWALLPIEDEVTKYAFPSKSSSYVLSGCGILAICGPHTSVAHWVRNNRVGFVIRPDKESIIEAFKQIEEGAVDGLLSKESRQRLEARLQIDFFVDRLIDILGLPIQSKGIAADEGRVSQCGP